MKNTLELQENLDVRQAEITELLIEKEGRITIVIPCCENIFEDIECKIGADFGVIESQLSHGGLNAFFTDPPGLFFEALEDQLLEPVKVFRLAASYCDLEDGLEAIIVISAAGQGAAEAGFEQVFDQGGGGISQQDEVKQLHGQVQIRVTLAVDAPDQCESPRVRFLIIGFWNIVNTFLPGQTPFAGLKEGGAGFRSGNGLRNAAKLLPDKIEFAFDRDISSKDDFCFFGLIMGLIIVQELFVAEQRDLFRMTAGVKGQIRVWQEVFPDIAFKNIFHFGIGTTHFIEHNPIDFEPRSSFAILSDFIVPAFLLKRLPCEQWMKNRVPIDFRQVEKIFFVTAADGIDGAICKSHRVDKCRQTGFDQFDKRILQWVFFRAAEHGMLEDMRNTGIV